MHFEFPSEFLSELISEFTTELISELISELILELNFEFRPLTGGRFFLFFDVARTAASSLRMRATRGHCELLVRST